MSYYTIAKYLRNMNADDLNPAFFDKVLLDIDSDDVKVDDETVKEIQDEFDAQDREPYAPMYEGE